jgi:hypothetical protein
MKLEPLRALVAAGVTAEQLLAFIEANQPKRVAKAEAVESTEFDLFWQAYPKRKGANPKALAREVFNNAVQHGIDPAVIIAAIKNRAGMNEDMIGTEFIPMAVTWLRQRRWQDHVVTSNVDPGIYVKPDDPAWPQLEHRWFAEKGKRPPVGRDGGWYFPRSWFPPLQAVGVV